MAQQYTDISENLQHFIASQKIFFVATATAESRINLSPKGMDSLRVIDKTTVVWLNTTGSGNETSAHVQLNPRMTIMFAAFEGKPRIVRLFGSAQVIHINDPEWSELYRLFNPLPGARQIFKVTIDLVQTSCGMAVPLFDYQAERHQLNQWARNKGEAGIKDYWKENNKTSLDGDESNIVNKNC